MQRRKKARGGKTDALSLRERTCETYFPFTTSGLRLEVATMVARAHVLEQVWSFKAHLSTAAKREGHRERERERDKERRGRERG